MFVQFKRDKKNPIDLQVSFPRMSRVSSVGHSLEVRRVNPVAFG
jgi:hypothetical protein